MTNKERRPSIIQQWTGSSLSNWMRRLEDYVKNPQQRSYMRLRLKIKMRKMFQGTETNSTLDIESGLSSDEIITRALAAEGLAPIKQYIRDEHTVAGCTVTPLKSTIVQRTLLMSGMTVVPKGASFREVRAKDLFVNDNMGIDKFQYRNGYFIGEEVLQQLLDTDPGALHVICTPIFAKRKDTREVPFYGTVRNGDIITAFTEHSTDSKRNEYEAGGVIIQNNSMEILPYSQLLEVDMNDASVDLVQQAICVGEDSPESVQVVLEMDNLRILDAFLATGYFTFGDEKRYFTFRGTDEHLLLLFLGLLNEKKKALSADSWSFAILELGGSFSGFLHQDTDEVDTDEVTVGKYGVVALEQQGFRVEGHRRRYFFDIYSDSKE